MYIFLNIELHAVFHHLLWLTEYMNFVSAYKVPLKSYEFLCLPLKSIKGIECGKNLPRHVA